MRTLAAFLLATATFAQIEAPRLGMARFGDGTVRRISGVSGSVLAGEPLLEGVLGFGASSTMGVAKLAEAVVVVDAEGTPRFSAEAPPGTASMGFSRTGAEALILFPETRRLMRCTVEACEFLDAAAPEGSTAVSMTGGGEGVFIAGAELIRMDLHDGATRERRMLDTPASLISPRGEPISLPEGTEAEWMAGEWAALRHPDGRSSALSLLTGKTSVLSADPVGPAFALFDGVTAKPLGASADLGPVAAGDRRIFRLRVTNNTTGPMILSSAVVDGVGFELTSDSPSIPHTLASKNTVEFRIGFTPTGTGLYSTFFRVNGTQVLLYSNVVAAPTVSLEAAGTGSSTLPGTPIDFDRIRRGTSSARRLRIGNGSSSSISVSAVSVSGEGFRLAAPLPSPLDLAPGASATCEILFEPGRSGTFNGTLAVGLRQFKLQGAAFDPPLPKPLINAGEALMLSARQQKLSVQLADKAETTGAGTLKMEFRPAATVATDDAAVRFLSGSARVQSLRVAEGDTAASFGTAKEVLFQSGTTAGTIVFTVELGTYKEQLAVEVRPERPGLETVTAVRTAGMITVTLTGYDNARNAGPLEFVFYDAGGKAVSPVIPADASTAFGEFYKSAPAAGGAFLLRAAFPVAGDASAIGSVDVRIRNGAGQAAMDRVPVR